MTGASKLGLLRRTGVGLLAVLALGGAYLGILQVSGNFNTVVPGEFYRSGQLRPVQIASYIRKYRVKTIINLRGDNKGTPWYDAEVAEARRLNVAHIDFGISARRDMTASQSSMLITLMRTAEKPILIHCQAGADRSGLASALYLAAIKNSTEAAAEAQLSIRYGHFSLPFIAEYAMDRTFKALGPSFGYSVSQSSTATGEAAGSAGEETLQR